MVTILENTSLKVDRKKKGQGKGKRNHLTHTKTFVLHLTPEQFELLPKIKEAYRVGSVAQGLRNLIEDKVVEIIKKDEAARLQESIHTSI